MKWKIFVLVSYQGLPQYKGSHLMYGSIVILVEAKRESKKWLDKTKYVCHYQRSVRSFDVLMTLELYIVLIQRQVKIFLYQTSRLLKLQAPYVRKQ